MIAPFLAALVLAAPCSAAQTRALFDRFVHAYNAGNLRTLNAVFAPQGDFQWYSSNEPGERSNGAATNRRTLIPYFRARHAQRDSLKIVRFKFNGGRGTLANFEFVLRRSASDYLHGSPFRLHGKGAMSCAFAPPVFVVISLGGPGSDHP